IADGKSPAQPSPAKASPVKAPAAKAPAAKAQRPRAPHLARSIRAAVKDEPVEPQEGKSRGLDIGQIITRALTAAGLMK
ncbi:hypothetical protein ACTGU6_10920, partial [Streptococcus suis]